MSFSKPYKDNPIEDPFMDQQENHNQPSVNQITVTDYDSDLNVSSIFKSNQINNKYGYQPPKLLDTLYQPIGRHDAGSNDTVEFEGGYQPMNGMFNNLEPEFSNQSDQYDQNPNKASTSRRYKRGSKIFLGISIASAILVLIFESYLYAVININAVNLDKVKYSEVSIYLSLFIFASIYQIGLTIVGLKIKSMLLLLLLCIFYCCMLVYTGIQYNEVNNYITPLIKGSLRTATRATNIATICVLAVTLISQAYLIVFNLKKDVSWFQYKKIGADIKIRRLYNCFQVYRTLLIFDFFFFLGFTIQFLVIMVKKRNSVEFILTLCVLPLTIIILFCSDLANTREWVPLSIISIILFLCGCAYVTFKIVRLFTKYTSAYDLAVTPGSYFPGRTSLVTFGAITLILLVLSVIIEVILVLNYNKGLLPVVSQFWPKIKGGNATYKKNTGEFNKSTELDLLEGGRSTDPFDATLKDSSIID